jgi:MFS family permease
MLFSTPLCKILYILLPEVDIPSSDWYDLPQRQAMMLTKTGIFEVGSFICGIAPNSAVLIIGRAVAGLGCSGIFSGALIILAHSVSLKWRPIFTGIVASMYGVSSVLGPILGGIFTDSKLTWRW